MAAIAAGDGNTPGVARASKIISIRIASHFTGQDCVGLPDDPCVRFHTIDVIRALDYVNYLRSNGYNVAAINFSGGSGQYADQVSCDASAPETLKTVISHLRSAGIPTVIATGNESYTGAMNSPACISPAISVAATSKTDQIWNQSNSASFLSLLAPGVSITLPNLTGGGTWIASGTSAAAPHVAGAWAILKQKYPTATVAQVVAALQLTALPIKDTRDSDSTKQYIQCRVRIDKALDNFPTNNYLVFDGPTGLSLWFSLGINKCQVAGQLINSEGFSHGFVMNGIGSEFMIFDVPNAVNTTATSINNTGHIVGGADFELNDGTGRWTGSGFIRFPSGSLEVPINASGSLDGGATTIQGMNDLAEAVGLWYAPVLEPGPSPRHGFLKPFGEALQTIDKPGAIDTQFFGRNNAGQIVGSYINEADYLEGGFLRATDGTYQNINFPGAWATLATGVNDAGYVAGYYYYDDYDFTNRGFVRSPDGTFTTLTIPNSSTRACGINNSGQVVGVLWDETGLRWFIYNSITE
jgi:hypothetical protein